MWDVIIFSGTEIVSCYRPNLNRTEFLQIGWCKIIKYLINHIYHMIGTSFFQFDPCYFIKQPFTRCSLYSTRNQSSCMLHTGVVQEDHYQFRYNHPKQYLHIPSMNEPEIYTKYQVFSWSMLTS